MLRRVAVVVAVVAGLWGASQARAATSPLKAVLKVSTHTVAPGKSITVDGSRSTVVRGRSLRSWSLSFGDRSAVVTGKGRPHPVKHIFRSTGRRTVVLTVVDSTGRKAKASTTVTVAKQVTPTATPTTKPTLPRPSPSPARSSPTAAAGTTSPPCGAMTGDATWSGDISLGCKKIVPSGVTLTVTAGTVVRAAASGQLVVHGTLVVAGTSSSPVTFTSSTTPVQAGSWVGIVESDVYGKPQPSVRITHAAFTGPVTAIYATGDVHLSITSSSVTQTSSFGIAATVAHGEDLVVSGVSMSAIGGDGLAASVASDSLTSPTITGNSISGAQGAAIRLLSQHLDPSLLTGNTGQQDHVTGLAVSGTLIADLSLPAAGLPWVIVGDRSTSYYPDEVRSYPPQPYDYDSNASGIYEGPPPTFSSTIPTYLTPGGILTVAPGVTLTASSGLVMRADTSATLVVSGRLVATGTSPAPAVLTSIDDDSTVAGGNGASVTPTTWRGIVVTPVAGQPAPRATLSHAVVSCASTGVRSVGSGKVTVGSSILSHVGVGVDVEPTGPGSAAVTSSIVAAATEAGIEAVTTATGQLTLTGNAIVGVTGPAITVTGPALEPSHLQGNTSTGASPDALELNGGLAEDLEVTGQGLPWVLAGPLEVPVGRTLRLDAGTTLAATPNGGLRVAGTLDAQGTAQSPITLGPLTTGDSWDGVRLGPAQDLVDSPDPTLTLADVTLTGGSVRGQVGTGSILDSTVQQTTGPAIQLAATGSVVVSRTVVREVDGPGIAVLRHGGAPTVQDDTVTDASGLAMSVAGTLIDPRLVTGNTATGAGTAQLQVAGQLVADLALPQPGVTWALGLRDQSSCAFLDYSCTVTVGPRTTLSIAAGTTVLVEPQTSLVVNGSLVSHGTLTAESSSPQPGTWTGITVATLSGSPAATLDLEGATVSYPYSISATGTTHVTIAGSTISHVGNRGIVDTTAPGASVSITGSTISDVQGDAIVVDSSQGDPLTSPTVSGTTITQATGTAIVLNSRHLVPSQLTGNTATQTGLAAMVVTGDLVADLDGQPAGLPWVLGHCPVDPDGPFGNVSPFSFCDLTVDPGVTLTLPLGSALKAMARAQLHVSGTLAGAGTFTSLADDVAGGDTNGDLNATAPAVGDWRGIATVAVSGWPAPSVQLDGATISYATVALTSSTAATLTHARLVSDAFGVAGPAPAADASCPVSVDATNTYWGSPTGPAPTGSGAGVSGCVLTEPHALL